MKHSLAVILSPIALIALCRGIEQVGGAWFGVWVWVPTMIFFWAAIAALILWTNGRAAITRWIQPSRGGAVWVGLALFMGLLPLPDFLMHWHLLNSPGLIVLWLVYALINPWFEEGYWRGLLLDATAEWNSVLSILYSSVWFAISHPLIWGVQVPFMRDWITLLVLFLLGAVWAVVYRRTKSLRWTVAGHMCANLFGMAVPVLLNLYMPSGQ